MLAAKGLSICTVDVESLARRRQNQDAVPTGAAAAALMAKSGSSKKSDEEKKMKETWGGVKLTDDDVLIIHNRARTFRKASPYIQRRCLAVDGRTVKQAVGTAYKDDRGKDRKYTR